jgi:hypothetical protein
VHKWWTNLDFVSIWKASSIVLAGAFGILGLLTEFKDKDKKITKWGRISLIGILVTTLLGVIAQVKESSDSSDKALALAKKSDETLNDIERSLSPLGRFTVLWVFNVDCEQSISLCAKGKRDSLGFQTYILNEKQAFPDGSLTLRMSIFADPKDAQEMLDTESWGGDIWMEMHGFTKDQSLGQQSSSLHTDVSILAHDPSILRNNGRIRSFLDLPGCTIIMSYPGGKTFLTPSILQIIISNGQGIIYNGPFKKVKFGNFLAYELTVPRKK